MSDYSYPQTLHTFGERDGLPPGNTEKTIKGADFDPEFELLVTSVNSKLNHRDPAFTGIMDGGTIDGGAF